MRTQQDLNQAFRDLKRDDDAPPLMSREDITSLLAAHPVAASTSASSTNATSTSPARSASISTTRSSRTPWLVGGSLALAATAAFVAFNTWDSTDDVQVVDAIRSSAPTQTTEDNSDGLSAERTTRGAGVADGAASMSDADGGNSKESMQSEPPVEPPKQQPAPRLNVETIRLAVTQLAPFGLQYANGRITYIEDGSRISIRADGIGSVLDAEERDASTLTPLMVVVYHDETHFSSWWDRNNPNLKLTNNNRAQQIKMSDVSSVNGLIAVRVPLEAKGVLAQRVDVVLWFAGDNETAQRLPDPYRQQIMSELGLTQTTSTTHYTLPDNSATSLVAASKVYPNPLRSGMATVRIQMKQAAVSTGIITDMFGKEIATAWKSQAISEGQNDLPLFGLDNAPTGVYNVLITFEGSQERIVQRLMIQR